MDISRSWTRVGGWLAAATSVAVVAGGVPAQAGADGSPALAPLFGLDAEGRIAGEYVVVLDDRARASALDGALSAVRAAGGDITAVYRSALTGFAARLPPPALTAARSADGVKFVEADVTYSFADLVQPVAGIDIEVQPDATWGIDRSDQRSLPLDGTYRYRRTGEGVRAYIIDSGVRISHEDFDGRAVYGWDVVGDDPEAPDCFGHGTHVGGTVGSTTYGIAKEVQVVAVNVCFGDAETSAAYVIEAVDWVTEHAERPAVVNMSLGFNLGSGVNQAVQGSIRSGLTYSVSAGNSAGPACSLEPASVRPAITSAASDPLDQQAGFSSFGTCVDLYAPGVEITSLGYESDTATAVMSGTSMSAPHTTGVAALYLERHPDAKPKQVAKALVRRASKDQLTGLGAGSPNKLLYSLVR